MLNDLVFIIINLTKSDNNIIVESIWSTKKLAKAALQYHCRDGNIPIDSFRIIERKLNTLKYD